MAWVPFGGGFVLTLPCDREAALEALSAAVAAARRQVLLNAFFGLAVFMIGLGMLTAAAPPAPIAPLAVFVVLLFAMIPFMGYLSVEPWIRYLEELRRGIEEGRVNIGDVCGRPLGLGAARR